MPSSSAVPGFLGEYFTFDSSERAGFSLADINWGATPVASNVLSSLGVNGYDPFWQGGPTDYFAARFTADIEIEKAGRYTFYLTSDDGSQLSLDGKTVIDNDGLHGAELKKVTLDLTAGQHPLELLYFEWGGRQTLLLDWAGPDTGGTRVELDSVVLPGSAPAVEKPTTGGETAGFLAEFFNFDPNKVPAGLLDEIDFSRAPDAQAVVDTLDYSGNTRFWQDGPSDYFAARFTADIEIEKAGRYTFYLTSDDGSQLSLDGKTVIDHDGRHGAELKKVTLDLAAGAHPLEVLYFEWTGQQTLSLDWAGPDTDGERVALDSVVTPDSAPVVEDPGTDLNTDPQPEPETDTDTGADMGTDTGTDTATGGETAGFLAEFFNFDPNTVSAGLLDEIDFSRAPDAQVVVDTLDYSGNTRFWQGGPSDYFAARFTADIEIEKAGRYTFYLTSDDGSQLSLDGKTVIDHDGRHGAELKKVTLDLAAGAHPLEVLYFEWTGQQTLSLDWAGPDTDGERVALDSVVTPDSAPVVEDPGTDLNTDPQPEPETDTDTGADMGTDTGTDTATGGETAGFLAEFFNFDPNTVSAGLLDEIDFSRAPDAQVVVDTLDYSGNTRFWQGGPSDYFAARFTADIEIEKAGRYTFYLTSDDGSQLSLDGKTVIDHDGRHGAELKKVTLDLAAGQHPLELLYFEWTGQQTLSLDWAGPDTDGERVALDSVVTPDSADTFEPDLDEDTDQNQRPSEDQETDDDQDEDDDQEDDDRGDDDDDEEESDDEISAPSLPDRTSSGGSESGPERLNPLEMTPGETAAVAGGRTTTLRLDTAKEIASIDISGQPAHGKASVNPDNSIALVLSDSNFAGRLSFDYQVKYTDGSSGTGTQKVDVAKVTQKAGWGLGQHYMLEEDGQGDIVVETGDNHRKVYVSESASALSLKDIAAREGISVGDIDTSWLIEHSEYGASKDMVLAPDAGMQLWYGLTGSVQAPSSHWLLFEAGYTYGDVGKVITRGTNGESELHPVHVTSWGEGAPPVLDTSVAISQLPSQNVVMSNLKILGGVGVKVASNILMTDLDLESDGMGIRNSDHVTLHDSTISYAIVDNEDGNGVTQGLLSVDASNLLLQGNVFHHNGWLEDYNMDGTGQAPDGFSHNVYLQWNTRDVTFRENITSQSSSIGVQLRGGGFAEGNLILDNNVAANFLGGNYKDFGHVGNFTYFADNVITSGAYKDAQGIGAKGWGATNGGYETSLVDNIVAHLANPDDPKDIEEKERSYFAIGQKEDASTFYDNTRVLNWQGTDPARFKEAADDRNLENVDVAQAMATTIQRYAANLTDGKTATIDGLADYILSLSGTEYDDLVSARDIVAYFQDGFGMSLDGPGASSHRFIPNDLASGMRWDNRVNWSNGETPGTGDNVDLGGNRVNFGTLTTTLKNLDLGPEGELMVSSGKLTVSGTLQADGAWGRIDIDGAGQFWTAGYADGEALDVAVQGGRFANTGTFTGPSRVHVGDNAEAILATDQAKMVVTGGSELRVEGSKVKVGFDGDGSGAAVLQMADAATLSFVADAKGFSTLGEFRSGAWDQKGSPVQSGVSLDGTLQIDLSDYRGGTGTHNLVSVDALDGIFDRIEVYGLASKFNARTIIDYQVDELVLEITSGNGNLSNGIQGTLGALSDESRALVDVLTAGEGGYDGGSPRTFLESAEISDLLF